MTGGCLHSGIKEFSVFFIDFLEDIEGMEIFHFFPFLVFFRKFLEVNFLLK